MSKRILIALAALALAVGVGLLIVSPTMKVARLSRAIHDARDAEEIARIATRILQTETAQADAFVADYAARSHLCAFDPKHRVFLIHDPSSGRTHEVYVGPRGQAVNTGDPALDQAVVAAIPKAMAVSFSIGDPPRVFSELRVFETGNHHVDFVLGPDDADQYFRYRYTFEGNRLTSSGLHGHEP